jgi:hypothetical protein
LSVAWEPRQRGIFDAPIHRPGAPFGPGARRGETAFRGG